jgi:PAS domain S-box-containing protein
MATADQPLDRECLFPGDSEMAGRMRAFDWSTSDLGPPEGWPENLRTAVSLCLTSRFPILLWWGPGLDVLYNDAYIPFLGETKHPRALGRPGQEVWGEIWDTIGPMLEGVRATGRATWSDDSLFFFARKLPQEEVHVRFTYGPILSADGRTVDGIFCPCTEITAEVVDARRLETLRKLGAKAPEARTVGAACREAAGVLGENPWDIPFAAVYVVDEEGAQATLAATAGVAESDRPLPPAVSPAAADPSPWPLASVLRTRRPAELGLGASGLRIPGTVWPEPAERGLVLPIAAAGQEGLAGLLVAGVSPRQVLDAAYRTFFELVAGHIGTALADAKGYEAERRRAEALAELDQAKTAFFSNISYEFRTPLTLLLGPVEDALADMGEPLPPGQRGRLEAVHRSSLRLMKLVNTRLDFSRIEAGRLRAVYEPTDLAALTAEVASNFHSACQEAGLRLLVDCPPMSEPVHVDRDMWEEVVLNLISNAFKFTFEGEIIVRLRRDRDAAELTVRDTVTGIPAGDLSRIFERFHRIEGTRGRTHEGTGIGLALVQELVKLHGGSVRAESVLGEGSTFTVTIPLGTAHLPADRIGARRALGSTAVGAIAYVEESLRWLPDEDAPRPFPGTVEDAWEAFPPELVTPPPEGVPAGVIARRPRVLWADDNADMRNYVRRLLVQRYEVEAVPDGEAALAAARASPPDLVLSDVMMPRLDGFGLLNALRADPATRTIPVILLSARAGEESRVEGLEAGADDYLIKPFSARELLARVGANLEMARVRREAGERLTYLMESIPDGLVVLDPEWRYTFVNAPAERMHGRPRPDLLGSCAWDVFPHVVGTEEERQLRRVASEQVTREFQGYHEGWGRWYENRAFPMPEGGVAIYFRDVTERRHAETALRRSEDRFRRYFDLGLIGMAITSPTKGCLEVNDEICRILGYTRQELLRKTWAEMTHPDDLAADVAQFDRVMAGEIDGYTMDKRWIRKDGRTIDTTISLKCLRHEDGSVDYFVALLQDITERKRAEEALRRSEALLAEAQQIAHIGSWSWDLASDEIVWSDEHYRIVGLRPQAVPMTAERAANYIHPDDREAAWGAVRRAARDRQPYEWCLRMLREDGTTIITQSRAQAVYDEAGRPVRIFGTIQDVTERVRAEEALRASEARLAADLAGMERLQEVSTRLSQDGDTSSLLLEIVDAAVAVTAADMGNIQLLDRVSSTLRVVASRGFEAPFLEFFDAVHDGQAACGSAMRSGERVVIGDVTASPVFEGTPALDVLLGAGVRAVQSTPLIGRSGQLVGMLSTHYRAPRVPSDRDLHVLDLLARQAADWIERTQAAEELRHAKVAAEAANRSKDEFLANVSHEIRTPFGAILGMTELVLDTPLANDQRECLETVKSATDSLLGLIDDLLDFSRIESGKLELNPSDFSLRGALSDTVRTLVVRARSKGLELVCDVQSDVPDALVGDMGRLRQVLLNLIGNAIKFTNQGQVSVRVEVADSPAPEGEAALLFQVTDTGIGIPPDGRERIFRAFEQADSSSTRRYGGTGLGLTIAARLVGLMGGTIVVESEPGRGSTFSFTARFGRQPDRLDRGVARPSDVLHGAAMPTPAAAPLRILVAEDSEFNARHLERLLTRSGHDVRVAADGREALNLADETAYDLLLLDLHIPELDGFQVVQAIRERERETGGHLPVIALTARARKEDREHCLAAGMDDYLAKPVRAAELFATIGRVAAGGDASRPEPGDRASLLASRPEPGDRASLLDPAILLAACGNEAGLLALCQDFRAYAPARLAEVSDASRARDASRLREAAHKFCGLLSVFSTAAGEMASDLEDHAARGRLDDAGPLVARLGPMLRRLIREVGDISYEGLRSRAEIAENPGRLAGA